MDTQLKELEKLLRERKYAEVEEALKARMAENSDDWDAKLLYGVCRQLQGDEAAFMKIHDEAMAAPPEARKSITASPLWEKYHRSYTGCIIAALIAAGVLMVGSAAAAVAWWARSVTQERIEFLPVDYDKYAGPPPDYILDKYDGECIVVPEENSQFR